MAESTASSEERAKSRKIGSLRGLAPYFAPYRVMVAASLAALVATACISLVLPLAVRRVVDGFETSAAELLDSYFLAALAIAGLLAVGTGMRYYLVTRLGERVIADIRKSVFDRMVGMSPAFYEKIMTGEVLSRITTDTTLILSVISSSISIALRNAILLVGALIMLVVTSPKLAGLVILLIPLIVVPIIVLGRRLRKLSRESQDWIAASSGNASEALSSVQTLQAFTHEAESRRGFADVTETAFRAAHKRVGVRAIMTVIVIAVAFAGIVCVLWVGARDVRAEAMTTGELVQFVIYAVILAGGVGALSEIWGELQRAAGATERLVELLNAEDTVTDPEEPRALEGPLTGQVSFENVSFSYPSRPEQKALDAVSFDIEPGETVALVGPSGAGKTTVIQLLLRFYDPHGGAVRVDGTDLRDIARSAFRRHMALVPQDPVIFAASARDNIRFGRPDATDAEVEAAAEAAAADTFLRALPQGYETYVGERGIMLSGGQKQRIALARAILRDAPILLLDEATSALDAESERAVQQAVDRLSQDRTMLIIAHRLATVKKADRILVFEDGRIVAEGTHQSLVADGGLYARLAKLQFTDGLAAE
ncbi:ABC transporter transmembrane domain-containing protein [Ovoidimarina sediminis]|uniref:ABC transporter transmembrane domain-containing protein n=1 Tax=Ovoidimarina sediminis TaxID=3079856 RepID=UPI002907F00A|nr:ABC transporter transmembrane domain-containing protein [Rhodophyticola sp. MJ-SS7]MDU8945822.1 ABC transporter transmembrane domain-containing protein [Rhodophyticola sp. MJ-SS7]